MNGVISMDDLYANHGQVPDDMFIAKLVFYPHAALAACVYSFQVHEENDFDQESDTCLHWMSGVMKTIPKSDNYNPEIHSMANLLATLWASAHIEIPPEALSLMFPSATYLYGQGGNTVADVVMKSIMLNDLQLKTAAELFRNGNVMRALTEGTL